MSLWGVAQGTSAVPVVHLMKLITSSPVFNSSSIQLLVPCSRRYTSLTLLFVFISSYFFPSPDSLILFCLHLGPLTELFLRLYSASSAVFVIRNRLGSDRVFQTIYTTKSKVM